MVLISGEGNGWHSDPRLMNTSIPVTGPAHHEPMAPGPVRAPAERDLWWPSAAKGPGRPRFLAAHAQDPVSTLSF